MERRPAQLYDLGIVPCGIADRPVTSLQQVLGRAVPMEQVKHAMARAFERVFKITFRYTSHDTEVEPCELSSLSERC